MVRGTKAGRQCFDFGGAASRRKRAAGYLKKNRGPAQGRGRRVSVLSKRQTLTASLRPLPALNLGVFDAAILICSPVRGLRPVEQARLATTKLPKPMIFTSWPDFRLAVMASNVASTAWPAPAFDMPVRSATAAMRSFLFISIPFPEQSQKANRAFR